MRIITKWVNHLLTVSQNKSADPLDNSSHFVVKESRKHFSSKESSPTHIHKGTIPKRIDRSWLDIDNSKLLEFAEDELDSMDSSEECDEEWTDTEDSDVEGDESFEAETIDRHKKWVPRPECDLDLEAIETYDSEFFEARRENRTRFSRKAPRITLDSHSIASIHHWREWEEDLAGEEALGTSHERQRDGEKPTS